MMHCIFPLSTVGTGRLGSLSKSEGTGPTITPCPFLRNARWRTHFQKRGNQDISLVLRPLGRDA
jgi:hypothetical protein